MSETVVQRNGDFLVRDSLASVGDYVLTCRWNNEVLHLKISKVLVKASETKVDPLPLSLSVTVDITSTHRLFTSDRPIYRLFAFFMCIPLREQKQYQLQISAQENRYLRIGHQQRLMKKNPYCLHVTFVNYHEYKA